MGLALPELLKLLASMPAAVTLLVDLVWQHRQNAYPELEVDSMYQLQTLHHQSFTLVCLETDVASGSPRCCKGEFSIRRRRRRKPSRSDAIPEAPIYRVISHEDSKQIRSD